ncbi:hypothetical protein H5T52_03950 [Candidatus Bipolaricaulota bacterium]|nr:hypothetical protein [Candidatus Bipolaricaulota bacterium]
MALKELLRNQEAPAIEALREGLEVLAKASMEEVSTPKMDELIQSLGLEGISKSEVFWVCQELNEVVEWTPTRV